MKNKDHSDGQELFVGSIREKEQQLFSDHLDPLHPSRLKSPLYSWLYRPSHHAKTGLITGADIQELSEPGKRLLSVGAHPAFLERVICELGVSPSHIVIADQDPGIMDCETEMQKLMFDATEAWPETETFDLIVFPESLCIALADRMKRDGIPEGDSGAAFPTDVREAELLAIVLEEALQRLRPGGEIRANGPMSHPNVVRRAGESLLTKGHPHVIQYQRYFLRVRAAAEGSSIS